MEEAKPTIKDQEEEIQLVIVEPTKPNITKI